MAKLSDGKKSIDIFVKNENEQIDSNVSTHPIETGSPITDHSQRESKTFEFDGLLMGKNQADVDSLYSQLLSWQDNSTLLQFRGAIRHNDMLITHLEKTYEEGGFQNAVSFNLTLTAVYMVKLDWVKATNSGKKQAEPTGAVYVTVQPGNTYWGWWVQYGTSIDQLRAWNGWPDRFIPIGARARVK